MTNHSKQHHPNLKALLDGVSPEEADRLREVWELAGNEEPTDLPRPGDVEQALRRFEDIWQGEDRLAQRDPSQRNTSRLARRLDRRPREGNGAPDVRRVVWHSRAVLAVVLLLGALGLFWWLRPVEQRAPLGERLALTLPDDSRVELNSGSRLRYTRRFGDVRSVHLAGEAFFDVAEEGRPFVVETFNARIQVLGTRFGVRAWPGGLEPGTTVALEAGRVALAPAGQPERAVTMAPGETRRVATGDTAMDPYRLPNVSVDEATAWRRGDLIFKDQPLGAILEDVERRFAVEIKIYPLHLQQKRYSLRIRRASDAEAVVRDLAAALGLRYRETSNGYELFDQVP